MNKKIFLSLSAVSVLMVNSVLAEEITGSSYTGFEASSRGGVSTTVSSSSSMFNNPATLDTGKYFSEASLNANVGYRENGLLSNINDLNNLDLDNLFDNVSNNYLVGNSVEDRANLTKTLDIVKGMNGNSVIINGGANLGINIGNFGIGVKSQGTVVGSMVVDQNRDKLIFDVGGGNYALYDQINDTYSASNLADYQNTSLEYAINNGYTYANIKYHLLTEVPLSYSHDMSQFKYLDGLTLGATVKYMKLETSTKDIKVNSEEDDITDNLTDNSYSSSTYGIDLGALYQLNSGTTFGLTAKNLNSPTFDNNSVEYKIKPSAKLGVSQGFFDESLKIAFDMDVTKNKSTFTNMEEQNMGLGLSLEPVSWFSLNGGLKKNISSWAKDTENDGLVYTAGLSFGFKWLQLGLSAEMSSDEVEVDGESVPKYASVNFGLTGKFGESSKRKAPTEVK